MLAENPDLVIAFHSNISASKGTQNCISQAAALRIVVEIIE